jgi:outer membrane protein assembly factor BamB
VRGRVLHGPRALAGALTLAAAALATAEDWPQWRGPHGNGVSGEKGLPTRWIADQLAWTARLGGLGISSPIVSGELVFVTSQLGSSALRPGRHPTLARGDEAKDEKPLGAGADSGAGPLEFLVEAFDRRDGRRVWQHRMRAEGELPEVHEKHNLASPSPVTDGQLAFAWFGNGQLVALTRDGEVAWQRQLARDYGPFTIDWGHASSPALFGELLLLLCDHEPRSQLVALDKRTGRERWKVERPKGSLSYSTPTVVRAAGRHELVVNSTTRIDAYAPETGRLLWWAAEPHRFAVPVPAFHDGVLYMSRGYRSGPYMAIRTGGEGDVSKSHVSWSVPTGAPYVSSLVHYEGLVYMASDVGVVSAIDAASGERVWQERVPGIFTASPVAGDGKVFLASEGGDTIVLAAGREARVLARNPLGVRLAASPAVAHGQLFLRSDGQLFAIGSTQAPPAAAKR